MHYHREAKVIANDLDSMAERILDLPPASPLLDAAVLAVQEAKRHMEAATIELKAAIGATPEEVRAAWAAELSQKVTDVA